MEAILLAAGEGSRLRPLTNTKPKPMIRAANKPILEYAVEALVANGIHEMTLVVGYRREKVQTYFHDGRQWGARIRYVFQEALLGTAYALAQAEPPRDEAFLVLGGDNIVDARIVRDVLAAPPGIALAAKRSQEPSKYGVLALADDRVLRIEEKPAEAESEFVNTGIYRFPAGFVGRLEPQVKAGTMGLTHVLDEVIREGEAVRAVRSDGLWMDALYPWDLLSIHSRLLADQPPLKKPEGVAGSAELVGPVLLGEDVEVGPKSVLVASTSVGNNVLIGPGSIVENSIIYDDVQIGAGSIIRNSVVGEGCHLGARFTALSGPADVRARDGWHPLRDIGTVIGEDTIIEGGVTLEPGVLVGNRSRIAAGTVVRRNVEEGSLVM